MTTDDTTAGAVPPVVRNKALAAGAGRWLRDLPGLIAELERDWSISVGRSYETRPRRSSPRPRWTMACPAVLKVHIDRPGAHAANEITVLRLADGGWLRPATAGRCGPRRPAPRTAGPFAEPARAGHAGAARDPVRGGGARLAPGTRLRPPNRGGQGPLAGRFHPGGLGAARPPVRRASGRRRPRVPGPPHRRARRRTRRSRARRRAPVERAAGGRGRVQACRSRRPHRRGRVRPGHPDARRPASNSCTATRTTGPGG